MSRLARVLPLLLLATSACASAPPAASSGPAATPPAAPVAPAATAASDVAPKPFTAEQIRAAMPVGHEVRFRVEKAGAPPLVMQWNVIAADAASMTMTTRLFAEDGTLVADEGQETHRWDALVEHAAFPAAATVRSEGPVEVPAGKFAGMTYVVRGEEGGAPTVTTYVFARELPGPPVSMVVEAGGAVVMRMTLLSRK